MPQMRLNHYLTYKKVILYRVVNQKIRYYSIELTPTLFGEMLLTRKYGGLKNKKPTRVIKEYFSSVEDSINAFESIFSLKQKKGYSLNNYEVNWFL